MHSKSDKIEITINDEADEVIKDLFDSLRNTYQNNLESIKDVSLSLIMFSYCIVNAIKQIPVEVDHLQILLIG